MLNRIALTFLALLLPFAVPASERDRAMDLDADPAEVPEPVRSSIRRGQEYLKGWLQRDLSRCRTSMLATTILALMVDGSLPGYGRYGKEIAVALEALLAHAEPSGLICGKNMGSMYDHGLSTLCLAEVWGMTGDPRIRPVLKRAVELIERCQNEEGGWRYRPQPLDADLSVTVMQIVALRAAENAGIAVSDKVMARAIEYCRGAHIPKEMQEKLGRGFSYTVRKKGAGEPLRPGGPSAAPRTAAGTISLQLCGLYDCPEVRDGIDGMWERYQKGIVKDLSSHVYYFHYYAMQAMYQSRDREKWQVWYPMACKIMMSKQQADGSFGEGGEPIMTAWPILAMGLPYRYLPIYQR